jgi:ABC-2 type transport system permease protein
MIRLKAIWALALRHIYVWKRDVNLILMALYWPLLDIFLWGSMGLWVQQAQTSNSTDYKVMMLSALLLWQVIGRGCNIMVNAFIEEIWAHNVINLFSLPLQLAEWICGVALFFTIMMSAGSLFCMIMMALLYDISFWYLLVTFALFVIPLLFSALWIGFTALLPIITFGKRGIEFCYVIIWFLMPFSGALYPVEVLPSWAQTISSVLPMYYVFKGMRLYVMHQDPTGYLTKGLLLSAIYATCAIMLFAWCFNHSKQKGLARLTD